MRPKEKKVAVGKMLKMEILDEVVSLALHVFFQAEDGIRFTSVTGVQTCALPIFAVGKYFHLSSLLIILAFGLVLNNTDVFFQRSEERRVGKEGRSRGSP